MLGSDMWEASLYEACDMRDLLSVVRDAWNQSTFGSEHRSVAAFV